MIAFAKPFTVQRRLPQLKERNMGKITRRLFIGTGVVAATGLAVGAGYLSSLDLKGIKTHGGTRLNAWIEILADNSVKIFAPRAEMGQGAHMGIATLIAEELDVPLSSITVEHASELLPAYINTMLAVGKRPEDVTGLVDKTMQRAFSTFPYIGTGGSTTLPDAWVPMRVAGATAREMIIAAAAQKWAVANKSEISVADGVVTHTPSKRTATYGELTAVAAQLTPPTDVNLKSPDQFKLIGKTNQARVDLPAKVNGTAIYGVDVKAPGMMIATLVQAPRIGATVKSVDDSAAKNMPGVTKIIKRDTYVAVVGKSYWFAKQALDALKIEWQGGEAVNTVDLEKGLETAFSTGKPHEFRKAGDSSVQLTAAKLVIEARYSVPYLAHMCMEPMNATAWFKPDGSLEVWAPCQGSVIMKLAADASLKSVPKIAKYNTTYLGGGFGRRGERDYVMQALQIAEDMPGTPVKLIWSREEDMAHDLYRPAALAKMRGAVDAKGKITALEADIAVQSVAQAFAKRSLPYSVDGASDKMNVEGLDTLPYALPNIRIASKVTELPVPVGNWRSVGNSQNAFFAESFVDELAHAANADPLDFRITLLKDNPRVLAVAQKLKEISGWGSALPENTARGVAIVESFLSIVGEVAEVSVTKEGTLKVHRVHCVVDCGVAVNPNVIAAQIQSGVHYGLSAALYGKTTFKDGMAEQLNFDAQDVLRLATAPEVIVHIMPSTAAPGGIGEPGTPPIAPAVANAIFALTKNRVRSLPLSDAKLAWG
jgi:isoquinoline 1-oxidoreductase subunit beta